jgi:hypothetical protein
MNYIENPKIIKKIDMYRDHEIWLSIGGFHYWDINGRLYKEESNIYLWFGKQPAVSIKLLDENGIKNTFKLFHNAYTMGGRHRYIMINNIKLPILYDCNKFGFLDVKLFNERSGWFGNKIHEGISDITKLNDNELKLKLTAAIKFNLFAIKKAIDMYIDEEKVRNKDKIQKELYRDNIVNIVKDLDIRNDIIENG